MRILPITALVSVCLSSSLGAQTNSWVHLQVSGRTKATCSVAITMGSSVFRLENIPTETSASEVAEDLMREINSARAGHIYHAATNGVDDSIVSIVADGSPTPGTTPWLGRLVPQPQIRIEPGPNESGIEIQRTDLQDTIVAIACQGERTAAATATVNVKFNGRTFTLAIAGETADSVSHSATGICDELSDLLNADPGFRSSVLRDDTGQLMIFVTGENMGGGVQLQEGPTEVQGVKFERSPNLFASQAVHAVTER